MKENDIVKAILKYLKTVPHCFSWKEHGGMYGTAGIPDIIACVNGRFVAFEVKTGIGKTTALQDATIRKILAAGGRSMVVRSVEEVRAVVEGTTFGYGVCPYCGDFFLKDGSRRKYCDKPECQRARIAANKRTQRKRKASKEQ